MNYRIAICDDIEADRRFIADMVNGWSQQRGYIAKIYKYTLAENFCLIIRIMIMISSFWILKWMIWMG